MLTKAFWSEALQRAIRTFAQTFVSIVGVSSFSVWSLDWRSTVGVSLGSAVIALLMAVDRSSSVIGAEKTVLQAIELKSPSSSVSAQVGCGESLR